MRCYFRQLRGLGLALISLSASGQTSPAKQPLPAISNLRLLTRNSGYIFDGTVLSVERVAGTGATDVATIRITFRIEHAIRGARNGEILAIREWAGLWNSGERYHPGERLLLFLYSPGILGLTSPVGGPLGRFAVDPHGNVLLENGRPAVPSLDQASPTQLRGKVRVSGRTFALAVQRAAE